MRVRIAPSGPHDTAPAEPIAIELGLKAYLRHRGLSDDWNRAYLRHDLTKALRCVRMLGFQDIPDGIAELADILGSARLIFSACWATPRCSAICSRDSSAK